MDKIKAVLLLRAAITSISASWEVQEKSAWLSKGTQPVKEQEGFFFFFGSLWIKWIFILRICNIELDKKYNILNTHAPAHRLRCKNIVKYSWNNCSPSLPSGVTNILNYRLIIFSFPLHFYYVCVVSVLKQCRNI